MIERSAKILFWLAAAFAFVMATLPQPPPLPGTPTDKVQHIIAFVTLTLLLMCGYPRLAVWRIILFLALFGAAIELVQLIPGLNRSGDMLDWYADVSAAIATMAVVLLARWLCREKPPSRAPR